MNSSSSVNCPINTHGILPNSSIYTVSLTFLVLFPIFSLGCAILFFWYRDTSLFLRKRSSLAIILSIIGTSFAWSVTLLFDIIGSQHYPCALFGFLMYTICPFVGGPVLLKGLWFSSTVAKQAINQNKTESFQATSVKENFISHLRVIRGIRNKPDKLKSSRFATTKWFWIFWTSITALPYFLAYFIRLGTDPAWNSGCKGCDLTYSDLVTLIIINTINLANALLSYSLKITRRDPLQIVRECFYGISIPLFFFDLSLFLYLIDPSNLQSEGKISWRSFIMVSTFSCIYIQTAHQVLVSRRLKKKLLFSPNINREDRYLAVMQDKNLKNRLRIYLNSELSGEIFLFLLAVENFKSNPTFDEHQAKQIYYNFIQLGAPSEINLPSHIRKALLDKLNSLSSSLAQENLSLFDEAYEDIKSNLLRDGFARFLNKLEKEQPGGGKHNEEQQRKKSEIKFSSSVHITSSSKVNDV